MRYKAGEKLNIRENTNTKQDWQTSSSLMAVATLSSELRRSLAYPGLEVKV